MLIEIKVPQLAETVSEASLGKWHKRAGDAVIQGDNLVDIETDKVVLEVIAQQAGVLQDIRKKEGAEVTSDEVLAVIDTKAKPAATDKEEPAPGASEPPAAEPKAAVTQKPPQTPAAPEPMPERARQADGGDKSEVRTSPAARQSMAEHGLSLADMEAEGRTRVGKPEVEQQAAARDRGPAPAAAHPGAPEPRVGRKDQRVPMTRLRRSVAERLLSAQKNAAILSTFNEVNLSAVMDLRQRYKASFKARHGVGLGYTSFFVAAVVEALKRFPVINASVDGNDIIYHDYYDIGIAVAAPRGLVVPILRDADALGFAETEAAVSEFARKAGENTLTLEDLSGGTFTITNGGVFGSMLSTPILNPPQSAILGMHKIEDRPIAEEGEVRIRPMMYVALSYDHRVIDGKDAVQFLVAIKDQIEDPSRLLLKL